MEGLSVVLECEDFFAGVEKLKNRVDSLGRQIGDLKTQLGDSLEEQSTMTTQLNMINKARTKLLLAKHCARNLGKPELASTKKSHTTQERFAASVTNPQLEKIGVPIRYKEILNKLGQLIEGRNIAVHESSNELARLLIPPASQQTYLRYQGLYPVLYGESIEERAERGDILDELL